MLNALRNKQKRYVSGDHTAGTALKDKYKIDPVDGKTKACDRAHTFDSFVGGNQHGAGAAGEAEQDKDKKKGFGKWKGLFGKGKGKGKGKIRKKEVQFAGETAPAGGDRVGSAGRMGESVFQCYRGGRILMGVQRLHRQRMVTLS